MPTYLVAGDGATRVRVEADHPLAAARKYQDTHPGPGSIFVNLDEDTPVGGTWEGIWVFEPGQL